MHRINLLKWAIFLAIEVRNMSTLFATTMFSVYMLLRHPDRAYPKTFEGKLEALDFDLVLSSSLPFQYFYDFILNHSAFNKPYLDLYVLSKLYQELIDDVMNDDKRSSKFSSNVIELERQKENIFRIIEEHQHTHFNFDHLFSGGTNDTQLPHFMNLELNSP